MDTPIEPVIDIQVIVVEIAKLNLERGDMLVFKLGDDVSAAQANNMAASVHSILKNTGVTSLVLRKSVDLAVITVDQIAAAEALRKVNDEPNGLEALKSMEDRG